MDRRTLHLVMPLAPSTVTAQQKRIATAKPQGPGVARSRRVLRLPGKKRPAVRVFHSKAYEAAEEELMIALAMALAKVPPPHRRAFAGPVEVTITLYFPYRARERAAVRSAGREIPHDTRPDLDNLCKLYLDALVSAGVLGDDGQVWRLDLRKLRSPNPRIEYRICETCETTE